MLGPNSTAERAAYEYLRKRILSGAAKGGTPILQQEVADQLGISRIPVRDAIKHLSAEGLVTVESNRRVIVTNMTVADVREVFLMSSALEGMAAREAAARLPDSVLKRLAVLAQRMEHAETDASDWLAIHEQFHDLIAAQCNMPRLQREIKRLRYAVEPYLQRFFMTYGVGELKGSKHGALLAVLRRRDGELAERAVRDHIERAVEEISAALGRAGDTKRRGADSKGREIPVRYS